MVHPARDLYLPDAESDPALPHCKKCAKLSCVLLARVSVSCGAVHIADKLICVGHITSFLSVTLMTLRLGFRPQYGRLCGSVKLNMEYFLFNFIQNLDYD